ncbi:hypothetical protein [Paracoccus sp. (in: a-proteobacteria)]|nr:hypothetical protein [Paracoccus sp. (in: a-proteobacteria)]
MSHDDLHGRDSWLMQALHCGTYRVGDGKVWIIAQMAPLPSCQHWSG